MRMSASMRCLNPLIIREELQRNPAGITNTRGLNPLIIREELQLRKPEYRVLSWFRNPLIIREELQRRLHT